MSEKYSPRSQSRGHNISEDSNDLSTTKTRRVNINYSKNNILPDGWKKVESRSRPGEYSYENIYTGQRQHLIPTKPAKKVLL